MIKKKKESVISIIFCASQTPKTGLQVCRFNRLFSLRQMAKGNIPLSEIVQAGKDRRPKKLGLVITSHIPLMELQDHKTFPLREC